MSEFSTNNSQHCHGHQQELRSNGIDLHNQEAQDQRILGQKDEGQDNIFHTTVREGDQM